LNGRALIFSSVIFLFYFLPLVLAVGLALQIWVNRTGGTGIALAVANAWLLLASLVFYAWGEWRLGWVLLLSGALSFIGGLAVARTAGRARFITLSAFVGANFSLLAWFKYSGLAVDFFHRLDHLVVPSPIPDAPPWAGVALPLGVSFFTFHGLSYVVDVYRRKVEPTRSALDFACYFALFPQLVAGPIVRFSEVAKFYSRRLLTLDDFTDGVRRFVAGLAKKVLIANQVSILSDACFALPAADQTAAAAWLGTFAYALQIYFDFSGYSDMAVGLGKMFGFTFPENFDRPYEASSVRDFWRRWHMTLSRFFRDYLYIPMGGNRHGPGRTSVNLIAVFALCGLWHGASWNFLFWGLFHGFFLSAERVVEPVTARVPLWLRPLGHLYTLGVVLFAWVLFRCDTWAQALTVWRTMLDIGSLGRVDVIPWQALAPDVLLAFTAGIFLCTPLPRILRTQLFQTRTGSLTWPPVTALTSIVLLALCLIAVGSGSHNPFIYFRF
jgi:alginate O-acetyltransferase complex protein AlgI